MKLVIRNHLKIYFRAKLIKFDHIYRDKPLLKIEPSPPILNDLQWI